MTAEPRDELAEVRSVLRQTWPSLTAEDVDTLPRSRDEAARALQEKTGASLEEIETTLSDLYALNPERRGPPPEPRR
jgi:hypothetical protein